MRLNSKLLSPTKCLIIPSKLQFSGPTVLINLQQNRSKLNIQEHAGIDMANHAPELSFESMLYPTMLQLNQTKIVDLKTGFSEHKQVHFSHVMG